MRTALFGPPIASSVTICAHNCHRVQIDVVLSFHNGGDEALNVSGIMGSINSPAAFNIYVHNLTSLVRFWPHNETAVSGV